MARTRDGKLMHMSCYRRLPHAVAITKVTAPPTRASGVTPSTNIVANNDNDLNELAGTIPVVCRPTETTGSVPNTAEAEEDVVRPT